MPAGAVQVSRTPPAIEIACRSTAGGPRGQVPQNVIVRTGPGVWPAVSVTVTRRSYDPLNCDVFQIAPHVASGWGAADGPPAVQGATGNADGRLVQLVLPA